MSVISKEDAPHISPSAKIGSGAFTRRPTLRHSAGVVGLTLALIGAATNVSPAAFAAEPSPAAPELTRNGDFEAGTTGWHTNNPAVQQLKSVTGGHYGKALELGTTAPGVVVANDDVNTVTNAAASTSYLVSAWVKAVDTQIAGQLRVRETKNSVTTTHASTFQAGTDAWQQVTLSMTTAEAGATLDLNVLGWDVPTTAKLLIDDISMTEVPGVQPAEESPTLGHPAPPVVAAPNPSGCLTSVIGIPSCGTLVGAAVGGNTDPAAFEKSIGGTLQIRRTYWNGSKVDKAVATAAADIAAGRLPWISFKLPYSWSDMAAGKGDAWTADLTAKLSRLNGPVWIAFHHEPEGDGNIADWVKMQQRLAPIVHSGSRNVAFTMIVTGWHQFYGDPQFSLDALWPGDGLVDLVGLDPYNWYGTVKNGKTNTKMDNFATEFYPQMQAFADKHNTAWGIAETGETDAAALQDPQWLARSYSDMARFGGVAFTYFNTALNSNGASWPITDPGKVSQFADILKKAKTGK
ncbi:carbohydrate binding domain-containing protein [Arthrobacter sp. H14-L1]|uniref:carbohydrate binding domain-containing protein n=1 Tax=Arthrobacter sp. H14-L1 TaxID=2996697 RepID=UPI00226FF07D|nr:carbohydrate binding domain-containing protein [Arthrobacter sp. H14-L1]MCY0905703.1 carbohydrate-binding protein CenC [Arthrobacter sp. H14-L1]